MILHVDLAERVVTDTARATWVPSPEPGVERILLDRDGGEVARATSVVRYAPGSRFSAHHHARGEEFLVLEGEFRDEHGVYPAGSYVRNPWGSAHAPWSLRGCTLFAKLRQIPEDDAARVCWVGAVAACVVAPGEAQRTLVLHETAHEWVALVRWRPGYADPPHAHPSGEELFVLEGDLEDEHGRYERGTWLRQPRGSRHAPRTRQGCLLFVKRGLL